MQNPWRALPTAPDYVLPEDRAAVEAANVKNAERRKDAWRYYYHLELLPDPYIGNLDAPVVLFSLNPGYTPAKSGDGNCNDDWWHANSAEMHGAYRRNFNEEPSEYPMFFLDPILRDSPGGQYWTRKLGELISACGDAERVAKNLTTIEFFPYHSNRFGGGCEVPSQAFARYQIQRAMARNALIIIVRAKRALLNAVPTLASYPFVTVNSPASGCVSRGNVPEFQRIVERINAI